MVLTHISFLTSQALQPVTMQRVCLDRNDTTITISWFPKTDNCGNFEKHIIYQQENTEPFTMVAEIFNITTNEYSFKTNNLNANKKFYLLTIRGCNGVDTLHSDTTGIDQTPPVLISLDSISHEFGSNDIILGWKKNPSKDTRGYNIYIDNGNAFTRIGTTNDTNYTHSPGNTRPKYTIATFDTCYLTTAIANPTHRSAYLTANYDSCAKTIALNWSLYEGWETIERQQLWISINGASFMHLNTFSPNITSYTIPDINRGEHYSIFIRTWKLNNEMSSSSNVEQIQTYTFNDQQIPDILNVTTIDNHLDVLFNQNYTSHINSINIYKTVEYQNKRKIKTYNKTDLIADAFIRFNDVETEPEKHFYSYQLESVNVCNESVGISNHKNSIHLTLVDNSLVFNHLRGFIGNVAYYQINVSYDDGFTWNTYAETNDTVIYDIKDTLSCYQIIAIEQNNPRYDNQESASNVVCLAGPFWAEVPNALTTKDLIKNNEFKVLGGGIDHNKSYYEIFNRWGQIIHRSSTKETWKPNNMDVLSGQYIYLVRIIGIKGETKTMKGMLTIIN